MRCHRSETVPKPMIASGTRPTRAFKTKIQAQIRVGSWQVGEFTGELVVTDAKD